MSGSIEQYRPDKYIDLAWLAMGSIDLDPASCAAANKIVKAGRYFTVDDGLEKDWSGNVWMNPPCSRGIVDKFAKKLVDQYTAGNIKQAITLTNNATDTRWMQGLMMFASAICFPDHRISFIQQDTMKPKRGNDRAQVFCYFGNESERFMKIFTDIGAVFRG